MNRLKRAAAFAFTRCPDPANSWCVVAGSVVMVIGVACVAIWWPR